jgi:DNA-binding transcriptional ArsR family regulator
VNTLPPGLINHVGRLDILCCLRDSEPLTIAAIAARIGKQPTAVSYLLSSLELYGIVRKTGEQDDEPLYEARLDEQPAWVREAVEAHCTPEDR